MLFSMTLCEPCHIEEPLPRPIDLPIIDPALFNPFFETKLRPQEDNFQNIFDIAREQEEEKRSQSRTEENLYGQHISQPLEHGSSSVQVGRSGSTLSSDALDLLEKLTHLITDSKNRGISKTTVTITTKNAHSPFNHANISIVHYKTAPHSFNIQLSGSPSATAIFQAHMASLLKGLQQNFPAYQINLFSPILSSSYRPSFSSNKKSPKKMLDKLHKSVHTR